MSWTLVGSVEVGPQDREVLVGSFSIEDGDDTIWFCVTQTSPADVWKYSYGLLTWKTVYGQELGSQKVYGDTDSEVFRLGVGLAPKGLTGDVFFTPRAYNRRWIAIDNPPLWSLTFEAQAGKMASSGFGGTSGVASSFVTKAGEGISLVRVNFP